MQNVASIHSAVNETAVLSHETVINWHNQKAERGELPHLTARLRNTALAQLITVLGPEEAKDPQSIHDNIGEIGRRWAIKNSANSATAQSYIARARTALADWLAWRQDPTKFRFKGRTEAAKARDKARDRSKKRDQELQETTPTPPPVSGVAPIGAAQAAQPSAPPPAYSAPAGEELRTFPLGKDRDPLIFKLPSDGISMADVRKIAFHLLSLAHDFDPGIPSHAQMFAIVSLRQD